MDPSSYPRQKKYSATRTIVYATLAGLAVLFFGYRIGTHSVGGAQPNYDNVVNKKAIVVLYGEVSGTVTFEQPSPLGPVTISGKLQGLSPDALRGFHVHQVGDLSGGCASAGPHFNPYSKTHGAPADVDRHVGDLGNIKTNKNGEANFEFKDNIISLNGPTSIVGRSVVVHAGTDDLGRGDNEESLKTGNAGARAACGVIGVAQA